MDQYQSAAGNIYGISQADIYLQQQQAYFQQLAAAQQNANTFNQLQMQLSQPQPAKPTDDPLLVLLTEE